MIYVVTLCYCIGYAYVIGNLFCKGILKSSTFVPAYLPAFAPIIIVLALQFEVGTDYQSYIEMAQGDHDLGWIINNNEFAFVWLNDLVVLLGEPQLIFLFSAIIQVIFLMLIFKRLIVLNISLPYGILLYFIFTSMFFSSMNGVRQYIAIYIFTFSFIYYYASNTIKFLCFILLSALFHSSAIFLAVLLLLRNVMRVKMGVLKISLAYIFLFIMAYYFSEAIITELISMTQYSHYVGTEYFEKKIDIINIISKLPKIVIVVLCSYYYSYKNVKLYEDNVVIINAAYLSTGLMIVGLFSGPLWRFYQYFDFFTLIPLLLLLSKRRKDSILNISLLILIIIFLTKVLIIPQGEYVYKTILI
jgi:hypothetical protein